MFVRWKKRQLGGDSSNPLASNTSLYAVLVENHRIEGKTRQKVVKYLGYIAEANRSDAMHQERFWLQVTGNLKDMGLHAEQREYRRIIGKLSETVPNGPAMIVPHVIQHDVLNVIA